MAGYSDTPLARKLGIKEGVRIALVNAPKEFQKQLGALPAHAQIVMPARKPLDMVLLFADAEKSLAQAFKSLKRKLSTDGMIWIAWPKKSSGVATDLSFECVQRIGLRNGLVDVKICAIDHKWSGLKFVYRLTDRAAMR